MLLRSITKHVRDQNWFAVFLDFFIVVAGILIAFQITNWNERREADVNLERAEAAIKAEVYLNYVNLKERVALTQCRKESLRNLGQRLMEPGDDWERIYRDVEDTPEGPAFRSVLRSPNRPWMTSVWDAELARGSLNNMEQDKWIALEGVYGVIKYVEVLQEKIQTSQNQLIALAHTTQLSQADRLRYFDVVSELDINSYWMEFTAGQAIEAIENPEFGLNVNARELFSADELKQLNDLSLERYGTCYSPVILPFLKEAK